MNKKTKNVFESEYYPEWYWTGSLHDAKLISLEELIIGRDWRHGKEGGNCLVLTLDPRGARERDVKEIRLYGYRILAADRAVKDFAGSWWYCDSLREEDGGFVLRITFQDLDGDKFDLAVGFKRAEADRKN
ncbi:MAG: hypothetical protein IJV00_06730 [Clostridia bacterium]|nr:hypothetical protein [Clostridia bacterium]